MRYQILAQAISLSLMTSIFAMLMEKAKLDMSDQGIFGFLREDNIIYCFILNGLISGVCGGFGDTIATYFNPSLVVMNVSLLCPIIG